jgi:hypothetical protein
MGTVEAGASIHRVAETFASQVLAAYVSYLQSIDTPRNAPEGKEVNDSIWGTITLTAEEVLLLDSPLVQRLRRVRQLGVVDLVYPGANHSRFEHSVGTLHQVGQLISSIRAHLPQGKTDYISDENLRQLRLAGLLHDVGHTVYSHVAERALEEHDAISSEITEFNRTLRRPKTQQLSELLAYYIIRSEPFFELMKEASRLCCEPEPHRTFCYEIADLVVGDSRVDRFPQMHELISGPFDADKMDYVQRDAQRAGVPSALDVVRLVQKIRAYQVDDSGLPAKLKSVVPAGTKDVTIVGIAPSGANTLDEVGLGRALLHEKVYGHHKVRAAEAVVSRLVLARVERIGIETALSEAMNHTDETWLQLIRDDDECSAIETALVEQLGRRDLPTRTVAFSRKFVVPQGRQGDDYVAWLDFSRRVTDDPVFRSRFTDQIRREAENILNVLGVRVDDIVRHHGGDLAAMIFLGGYYSGAGGALGAGNEVYVIGRDRIVTNLEAFGRARAWSDAHLTALVHPTVFAHKAVAAYAGIAAEVVLHREFGLLVDRNVASVLEMQLPSVEPVRRALAPKGYFDGDLRPLRPYPEVLRRADAQDRLQRITSRLRGYQLLSPNGAGQDAVAVQRRPQDDEEFKGLPAAIRRWTSQFDEEAAAIALEMLEEITFLDVPMIEESFRKFMESDQGRPYRGANVVPLGGPQDGSFAVGLALRDIASQFACRIETVENALRDDMTPLLFVDDFVGTGSSAAGIFASWLGHENPLGENRPALPEDLQNSLKSRKSFGVSWVVGSDGAVGHVESKLVGLELHPGQLHFGNDVGSIAKISDYSERPGYGAFIEKCKSIAQASYEATEPDWTSDKVQDRLLGYGNRGLLLLLAFNTPTATLTALWAEAPRGLAPPPFPRRKKT